MSTRDKINKIICSPLILFIWVYQKFISPLLPSSCIYYPSCSTFAKQALLKHGLIKGGYLSVIRLLRCHPFHVGGVDEVPESFTLFETLKNG